MSTKRQYPFPYKTVSNENTLEVSMISIENITIQSPSTYPTYTLTLPPNDGNAGQILTTNGSGVLSWTSAIVGGTVTSVSASVPAWLSVSVTNPTTTPAIAITGTSTGSGTVSVLQTNPTIKNGLTIDVDHVTVPGQQVLLNLKNDENAALPIRILFDKQGTSAFFGAYFDPVDPSLNYIEIHTRGKTITYTGDVNFRFPTSNGSSGQVLQSNGGGSQGTQWITLPTYVSSVSATVPAWLSVTVTNPTTTPAIAITGFATGTGTVTVLQDSPTINNTLTVSDKIDIPRNSSNGEAIRIHNAHSTFPTDNYISVGHNSNGRNHAIFGHTIIANNNLDSYAYIQVDNSKPFVVTNNLNVGIGLVNPAYKLEVSGVIRNSGNLLSDGYIASGTISPAARLHVFSNEQIDPVAIFQNSFANVGPRVIYKSPSFEFLTALGGSTSPYPNQYYWFFNGEARLQMNTAGDVGLGTSITSAKLTVGGVLHATTSVRMNNTTMTGAGTYTITLPPTAGTNGQVLTTNGSGVLSWTSPSTGSVTSVAATSPLASSGGATPTISIQSFTGTGAVVLENFPVITGGLSLAQLSPANSNIGCIFSNSAQSYTIGVRGDTSNVFAITDNTAGAFRMVLDTSGNVGIGTTTPSERFHVANGQMQVTQAGTGVAAISKIVAGTVGSPSVANEAHLYFQTIGSGGGTVTNSIIGKYSVPFGYHLLATADTFVTSGPIALNSTVTLKLAPASTTFDFILPSGPGTSGQYLISGGAGAAMYWGSGGGGGGGSVNSVTASAPLASSGGTAPNISIASSTGTGAVVLANTAAMTELTITGTPAANIYVTSGTAGIGSVVNTSTLYLTQVGGGGGYVNQFIQAAYSVDNGYYISVNPSNDFIINSAKTVLPFGYIEAVDESSAITNFTQYNLIRSKGGVGVFGYKNGGNNDLDLRFASVSTYGTPTIGMTLKSSGNVGIGTLTPGSKLEVNNTAGETAIFTSNVNFGTVVRIAASATNGRIFKLHSTASGDGNNPNGAFVIDDGTANVRRFVLDAAGNVGIGTTAPTQRLDVAGNTQLTFDSLDNDGFRHFAANNTTHLISLTRQTNDAAVSGFDGVRFIVNSPTAPNSGTVAMRINSSANVGIGTTSPAQRLHVSGTTRIDGAIIQSGGESTFSSGTFQDPHVGTGYNAKFGNATPGSNGICVKGNSRFTDIVVAQGGFTTNINDVFTYTQGSFTPRLGAFRRPDGLLYELSGSLPNGASITASYSTQSGYFVKTGKHITVNIELRWTISISGSGADDFDQVIILPDAFNSPNSMAVTGACLQFPNSIGGIANPMGILLQYPSRNTGGNVSAIFITTATQTIAYPQFAPGGTQVLQFSFTWCTSS